MYASNDSDNVVSFASKVGKVPPQCIEAELAVLGGILLDPEAILRVRDILKPEHFYVPAHIKIYEVILKLNASEKQTDLLTVTDYLSTTGLLDKIGGRNKLAELIESTVSAVNIDALAKLVIEKYKRRQFLKLSTLAAELAHESDEDVSINNACSQVQEFILNLQQERSNTGAQPLVHALVEAETQIQAAMNGTLPGVATGFYDLDVFTHGGIESGEMIVVAGRPAMGKSAFAAQIGFNIAERNMPVVIFSLEMSSSQVAMRFLSSTSGIENSYLKSGRVGENQQKDLYEAINKISNYPIYIDECSSPTIQHIEIECQKIIQKERRELGVVIVDYLQLMGDDGKGARHEIIDNLSRGLKRLAKKLNVPVICLSQLSRGVESRTNKRPVLADLKESSGIEQNADKVIMLYRDEYYSPDTTERGIAEVIVAKNRNGSTGLIKLLFDGQFTKFKNMVRSSW